MTPDEIIERLLGGYTEEQLQSAFGSIQDKEDWRNPIHAIVKEEDRALVAHAIEFFTATTAYFYPLPNFIGKHKKEDLLYVSAVGYRAGPAGDH